MNSKLAQVLCDKALSCAKALDVDQIEVFILTSDGFTLEVAQQEIDSLEAHNNVMISVTVFVNNAKGHASGTILTQEAVQGLVEKAKHLASFSQSDKFASLADKSILARSNQDLSLFHPWGIDEKQAETLSLEAERLALKANPKVDRINSAWVESSQDHEWYINSNLSHILEHSTTTACLGVDLIAADGASMQRGYDYTIARSCNAMSPVEDVVALAVEKAVSSLGSKSLSNQKVPVLFAPSVAKKILGYFVSAISGARIYKQASFLTNKLNQKIFPDFIHIKQQPHLSGQMGSRLYDLDGVATNDIHYIENGVLTNYCLSQYSANRLGMQTTGNAGGVFNLEIDARKISLPDALQQMHKGLWVTDMMGQGVDLVTGKLSNGVSGYWVENGEIQFPVHQVTIACDLQDLYRNIILVCDDVDIRSSIRSGSLLVDNVSVSGSV